MNPGDVLVIFNWRLSGKTSFISALQPEQLDLELGIRGKPPRTIPGDDAVAGDHQGNRIPPECLADDTGGGAGLLCDLSIGCSLTVGDFLHLAVYPGRRFTGRNSSGNQGSKIDWLPGKIPLDEIRDRSGNCSP